MEIRTHYAPKNGSGDPIFKTSYLRDARRDWIRNTVPNAGAGYVVEDLDLIMRHYEPGAPYGRFMNIEFKWNTDAMPIGQRMTHELEHKLLRRGDPNREYYIGFYLVNWPALPMEKDQPAQIDFAKHPRVNGQDLTWTELRDFLMFRKFILSLFDNGRSI